MKKISLMTAFGIFTMIILMQLSCATAKDDQADSATAVTGQAQTVKAEEPPSQTVLSIETTAVEEKAETKAVEEKPADGSETPAAAVLLADTHKDGGVECSDCHAETPPANEVPTETCLTCHEDYKDVALSSIDPHNAHVEFTNCGDCHHSHRESENQCLSCHSFSLKAP